MLIFGRLGALFVFLGGTALLLVDALRSPPGFWYATIGIVARNVREWCADWFSADYHTTDAYDSDNPTGPDAGTQRVMRGGSHLCHRS